MMKRFLMTVAVIFSSFAGEVVQGQAVDQGPSSVSLKEIDSIVSEMVPDGGPGAAVLVVHQGDVIHQKGYGLADIENNASIDPKSCFRLASVSKQFTAACILTLVAQEELSLDDLLSDVFPHFGPWAESITIRHLLHHTAGLPDYMALMSERVQRDSWEPNSMDVVNALASQAQLEFEPGTQFSYSNSAYVTLAMIVQEVSGERFADFAREKLLMPLGMKHSLVRDERQLPVARRVKSYRRGETGWESADEHPLNRVVGDGAFFSTLEDFVLWDKAWREGLVLNQELRQACWRSGRLRDRTLTHYGYGWGVAEQLGQNSMSHSGGWLGFRTYIIRYLETPLTVVVLCNWAGANPAAMANSISQWVLKER